MIKLTTDLYAEMNETLGQIAISSENILQHAERSYKAVEDIIQRMKDYIVEYHFKDEGEEIAFFKETKPRFLSELIYHMEVFYIEAGKPITNRDAQALYYKQEMERVNIFFERNQMLYIYYKMGKTNLDSLYFKRNVSIDPLFPEYSADMDPRFTTVHSFKFGKIQAYEQLNEYLQHCLYTLDHPEALFPIKEGKKPANLWTDSKAALIELAYALHSRGAINNGKGDVKQLITDLEQLFNIQVGNFYRTFQSMRIRKKNRTVYLDTLKESLERKMDDTDLRYN